MLNSSSSRPGSQNVSCPTVELTQKSKLQTDKSLMTKLVSSVRHSAAPKAD